MKRFEILDISADAGIRAFGRDLKELFINAALGMFSLMTDLNDVRERQEVEVSVEGSTLEGTFVSWLNEFIFRFDTYGFVGKKIVITRFLPEEERSVTGTCAVRASVSGEEFESGRHKGKLLIKAATYHKLTIEKTDGIWQADVIFDI
jgi:SHS2 domain-containing protein